jgi:lipopolysaccharide export system protein LptA
VLLAKERTVLQGMIDSLNETGRYCGMKMNVEKKTKVMRISRESSPVQIMLHRKQPNDNNNNNNNIY